MANYNHTNHICFMLLCERYKCNKVTIVDKIYTKDYESAKNILLNKYDKPKFPFHFKIVRVYDEDLTSNFN